MKKIILLSVYLTIIVAIWVFLSLQRSEIFAVLATLVLGCPGTFIFIILCHQVDYIRNVRRKLSQKYGYFPRSEDIASFIERADFKERIYGIEGTWVDEMTPQEKRRYYGGKRVAAQEVESCIKNSPYSGWALHKEVYKCIKKELESTFSCAAKLACGPLSLSCFLLGELYVYSYVLEIMRHYMTFGWRKDLEWLCGRPDMEIASRVACTLGTFYERITRPYCREGER